jgi:Fungal specific transcription factor domain/Fungal Zn(2)-Cys(6) binuclear cluster domain
VERTNPSHIETKHPPPTPPGSSPKRHLYGDGSNRYKKPRTSNACRGCADSKVKCDGVTPICGRCRRRDRDCVWTRPKDTSPRFKSMEHISDGSTTSSVPDRRGSDQSMAIDPPNETTGFPGEKPTLQYNNNPPRQFAPVLSFGATGSATAIPPLQHRHSFPVPSSALANYSSTIEQDHGTHQANATSEALLFLSHAANNPAAQPPSEYSFQSSQSTQFPSQPPRDTVYPHPGSQFAPSLYNYSSDYYSAPVNNTISVDANLAWNIDSQFDLPGQGLTAIPFNLSYDPASVQWSEKFENMLAEGLDVKENETREHDTPSIGSQEEDTESLAIPQPERRPTSYPILPSSAPIAPFVKGGEPERRSRSQPEYLGYEYGDQRDPRVSLQNMEVAEPTNILMQESARRIRGAGAVQPGPFGSLVSNIRLSEDKRDDIQSMLDDTFAHSRLLHPTEQKQPRLPRLEIFNILLKSYFHNFHPQHPFLHLPSIFRDGHCDIDKKKDILIYAMSCAGAFRHASRPIQEYARGMQELLRRTFNFHFEKDPRSYRDLQSMQAWHLSLAVGGWSGNARSTEFAHGSCGAVDAMLRCGGYFDGQRGDWFEDERRPVVEGEEEERWMRFVEYEEKKRLVLSQIWFECHLGSFLRVKSQVAVAELTLPVPCETDLWCATSSKEWAKLWNEKLAMRPPRPERLLSDMSVACVMRRFVKLSEDFETVDEFVRNVEYRRLLPSFLLGIHSIVATFSDNRSCFHWDSRAMYSTIVEARRLLNYWWAISEACAASTDWLEQSFYDIGRGQSLEGRSFLDTCALFYHFTALMLHVPLREIRLMNERNHLPTREAATTRLWRTWKDRSGEDARFGLWHAGQIIRLARSMISKESSPLWLAPMVAEAANVMWSYGALIHFDDQMQRGGAFNGEHFLLDYDSKWEDIPPSTRNSGIPSIAGRKGEILTLFDPAAVVTECAEMLNRGPVGRKSKHPVRGRTILDEQFISQLDKLVKFGKIDFLVAGLRESGTQR